LLAAIRLGESIVNDVIMDTGLRIGDTRAIQNELSVSFYGSLTP
jgi:hypothetical protein